ncbi:MAG: hypothetical protein BGP25_15790 [Lysobacterales bacterium 63-13]|nr:MAG: hypothetical protein BGP25_15790 [Xanthomonadales bacterium 63-13]
MRVFDRLSSVVRAGDEVRLTIKRDGDGHEILIVPVLRDVDADESDPVIRNLQALLAVPTRIKVPQGADADAAVEAYLAGSEHAERASAVTSLGDYTDAIREANNAAKVAVAAKSKPTTASSKTAKRAPAAATGSEKDAPIENGAPAVSVPETKTPAATATTDSSPSSMSVMSLFGDDEGASA